MPFEVGTLQCLENGLTGAFKYHDEMDTFVLRAGIPSRVLKSARQIGEVANQRFDRAPKRFVAQALINILHESGSEGDEIIGRLISELSNGMFPNANPSGMAAINQLKSIAERDHHRKRKEAQEKERKRKALQEARESERSRAHIQREKERDSFLAEFGALMEEENSQRRGYALEKFLKRLFDFEELQPRGSFRIKGEQIDGSILWNGNIHLVEAKWQQAPVAGAEFGAFQFKLEGKSADTRGLFISIFG